MRVQRIAVAPGVELAVDRWAPPVDPPVPSFVLVHGLASNARLWDGVARRLVDLGHEVATVDLRGHGRSSKPDGGYDVPTVADDVAALIDGVGFRRPVVAGQSWGGNVVLELAVRHPDAVRGVACVDGGWIDLQRRFPDWEDCRARLAPPPLKGRPFRDVETHVRAAHPDWPEEGIAGTLANFDVRPDGTIAPWLTFDRHIEVLRGLWEHRPSARYPRVAAPVLLVPAAGDDAGEVARKRVEVEAAADALACAEIRWFRGDHDIHAQHPVELADVMHTAAVSGLFA